MLLKYFSNPKKAKIYSFIGVAVNCPALYSSKNNFPGTYRYLGKCEVIIFIHHSVMILFIYPTYVSTRQKSISWEIFWLNNRIYYFKQQLGYLVGRLYFKISFFKFQDKSWNSILVCKCIFITLKIFKFKYIRHIFGWFAGKDLFLISN